MKSVLLSVQTSRLFSAQVSELKIYTVSEPTFASVASCDVAGPRQDCRQFHKCKIAHLVPRLHGFEPHNRFWTWTGRQQRWRSLAQRWRRRTRVRNFRRNIVFRSRRGHSALQVQQLLIERWIFERCLEAGTPRANRTASAFREAECFT